MFQACDDSVMSFSRGEWSEEGFRFSKDLDDEEARDGGHGSWTALQCNCLLLVFLPFLSSESEFLTELLG